MKWYYYSIYFTGGFIIIKILTSLFKNSFCFQILHSQFDHLEFLLFVLNHSLHLLATLSIPTICQLAYYTEHIQFSSVKSLSHVRLFVTPWTAACQASLSITNSWSLLKLMPIERVMPSKHRILCCPLFLPPSIFSSIRVFSNESALRIRWFIS